MAETSGFFNAEQMTDGTYDRQYVAQQFANYFKLFIGNGVFSSPTHQLLVSANSGMNVTVAAGWAFIDGYWYHNDSTYVVAVTPNATGSSRTDGVFVQLDSSTRMASLVYAAGRTTPNTTSPIKELLLASIVVGAGAIEITNTNITDKRTDESVCGMVTGLLDVIGTDDLFQQFTATFTDWFNDLKASWTSDATGILQAHVTNMNNPHQVTKAQLNLGNVDNTADSTKTVLKAQTADKLTTARTINGVSFDGGSNVTVTSSLDNYNTTSPGTSLGQYTKIMTATITSQYEEKTAIAECILIGHSTQLMIKGRLFIRVKQQDVMTTSPLVSMELLNNYDSQANGGARLNLTNFYAVITTDTSSQKVIDVYYKPSYPYGQLNFSKVLNIGFTFLSLQPYVSSFTGTYIAASQGRPQIIGDHSFAIGDNTITGAIAAILSATLTTSGLTAGTGCSISSGGYCKLGQIVILQITITTPNNISTVGELDILSGLPHPANGSNVMLSNQNTFLAYAHIHTTSAVGLLSVGMNSTGSATGTYTQMYISD